MRSETRESIGRPLLSDIQNCAFSPGHPSQDSSGTHPAPPQSCKTSSSHLPPPDGLGWGKKKKNLSCLGSNFPLEATRKRG